MLERGANEDVHEDCCRQGVGQHQDEDEFNVSGSHGRSLASGSPRGKCSTGFSDPASRAHPARHQCFWTANLRYNVLLWRGCAINLEMPSRASKGGEGWLNVRGVENQERNGRL